ncbi:hypothetical protein B0A50_01633 [Salinomyces thailandicus]|uniref:Uncharacterized protein n=1 Tax=Salinomyces thailandicus TaxID=706561 RepID=A0A4U0UDW9_9PEZI|nr:hypothetical protein B0A50_01633 [Salinomyces thailandica]
MDCCIEERQAWRVQTFPGIRKKHSLKTRLFQRLSHRRNSTTTDKTGRNFLDLPPELREIVFKHYMEDWSQQRLTCYRLPSPSGKPFPPEWYTKPIPPHEPPITRVSSILRKESLPIFYERHRFPVVAHLDSSSHYISTPWYERLDIKRLRQIQRLEVYFCFEMRDRAMGFRHPKAVSFDVDLHPSAGSFTVSRHVWLGGGLLDSEMRTEKQYLQRHVEQAAETIVRESGAGGFTANDIYSLVPSQTQNATLKAS